MLYAMIVEYILCLREIRDKTLIENRITVGQQTGLGPGRASSGPKGWLGVAEEESQLATALVFTAQATAAWHPARPGWGIGTTLKYGSAAHLS